MTLSMSYVVVTVLSFVSLCASSGEAASPYSPLQQQRLFTQMIDDLRSAYNDKLSQVHKRMADLEHEDKVNRKRVAELEHTLETVLSGKLSRESRLINPEYSIISTHVAFYVQLTHDLTSVGNYQAVVYDLVTTNVGAGYNKADGIFTAPVSGTYVFSWTSYNAVHTAMQTELVVNNVRKGRTWSDAYDHNDTAVASNTVVVELNANDVVWIRSNTVHSRTLNGGEMSTFSGWLLYAS